MGKIFVPDQTGHTEAASWLLGDVAACVVAEQTFNRLKSEGMAAFAVNAEGETEGVMQNFDPAVEEITFLRPFVGG